MILQKDCNDVISAVEISDDSKVTTKYAKLS